MNNDYVLTISCPDQVGIVAAVSHYLSQNKINIASSSQHSEAQDNWFYMRVCLDASTLPSDPKALLQGFSAVAENFNMEWRFHTPKPKPRVIILASKQMHCLNDLIYRWKSGELPCDVVAVIDNHPDAEEYTRWGGVPFHYVPIEPETKATAMQQIDTLIEQYRADVIVLARFMQVLPPELCKKYHGKIINIHHSFLPAFVGAKPYEKAFEKGVKLVGATCHYVTEDLDQGPIIEQDVVRVHHGHSAQDIQRMGRDVEKAVLARGLRYHLEHRVIVHGNKTVVF